jgi:hypothetical protein
MENNKNIWLLPTNEPSRLYKNINEKLNFNKDWVEIPIGRINQNIYITNNEIIKDYDWYISSEGKLLQFTGRNVLGDKFKAPKVILTSDPKLIADGIQSIPDEFLEWFVNNSSCERVEVKIDFKRKWVEGEYFNKYLKHCFYKIIIPKEEPKQETLEAVAERECKFLSPFEDHDLYKKGFIEGAEWQQEQIYNEIKELYDNENITGFSKRAYAQCLDIVEQFKKK